MSANTTGDTPEKRGAELFMEHCNPVIWHTSNTQPADELARLYGGIFDALYGSMCADFGFEGALAGLEVFSIRARKFSASEGRLPC